MFETLQTQNIISTSFNRDSNLKSSPYKKKKKSIKRLVSSARLNRGNRKTKHDDNTRRHAPKRGEEKRKTFGDMNVALPIINVEAPQEPREEVEENAAEVIAKPRLEEAREWAPHPAQILFGTKAMAIQKESA